MSLLLIELPAGPEGAAYRYALSPDGQQVTSGGEAAPALLPTAQQVVLVVPPTQLSWHEVQLPPMSSTQWATALPALVEDRLLQEPSAMHLSAMPGFAPGRGGLCQVAACDRSWLAGHLHTLETALARPVTRIAPWMPPTDAASLTALNLDGQGWWCQTQATGVLLWPLDAPLPMPPTDVSHWKAEAAVAARASDQARLALASTDVSPRWTVLTREALLLDALRHDWDLAQHSFRREAALSWHERGWAAVQRLLTSAHWRPARRACAILLGLNLLGLNLYAWTEQHQTRQTQATLQALLLQTFPNIQVAVDPPVQMRRAVEQLELRSGASASAPERLLQFAGQLPHLPPARAMDYQTQRLVIRGAAPDAAQLQAWSPRAQAAGLSVRTEAGDLIVEEQR